MQTTTSHQVERTLTEFDFARLSTLANGNAPPWLAQLLDTADVLDGHVVPPDTVTMNSTVELKGLPAGGRQTLTVCYPADAEPGAGFVSVLSPVGCGLMGLKVGDIAHWQTPSGEQGAAEVLAVLFQPQASGD